MMSHRVAKNLRFSAVLTSILMALMAFAPLTNARAQEPVPISENSHCVTCHESLYLLHDTGNSFCLNESPMTCVDCHGGDPTAITKETAHAFRNPHPIGSTDTLICQTCHPVKCSERVALFDRKAGFSAVMTIPTYAAVPMAQVSTGDEENATSATSSAWRILPILVLVIGSISMGIWINREYRPV